ncbi:MAG: hypothetical protein EPO40_31040 [Myxococcaceae bacterium]|nr:MAG: hypothetical protein EPO40_31040 [Myxococcaceae bacterium]
MKDVAEVADVADAVDVGPAFDAPSSPTDVGAAEAGAPDVVRVDAEGQDAAVVDAQTSDVGVDVPPPVDVTRDAGTDAPTVLDAPDECTPSSTRPCYTGPGASRGVGLCRDGVETCDARGHWAPGCAGMVLPTTEVCNGADDDCNAVTDDAPQAASTCPEAPNARAVCSEGRCGAVCLPGHHDCGGSCVSDALPTSCGALCSPCPAPANSTATCVSARCGYACNAGFHACSGVCVSNTSTLTCGTRCSPCSNVVALPANATLTCNGTICWHTCNRGFVFMGIPECGVPAPHRLSPMAASTVTTDRPTLRWTPAADVEGTHVDICRDRFCTMVEQSFDVTGSSLRPTVALAAGVHFWRASGRIGAVTGRPELPWVFLVPARSTPLDLSHGTAPDFNGDGYADLAVSLRNDRMLVYYGSLAGLAATPTDLISIDQLGGSARLVVAGDVNGDGYIDLTATAIPRTAVVPRTFVYWGSNIGLSERGLMFLPTTDNLTRAGDFNGDGYADLVTITSSRSIGQVLSGAPRAVVGPFSRPFSAGPTQNLRDLPPGDAVAGVGDFNGDGFADIVGLFGEPLGTAPWVSGGFCLFPGAAMGAERTVCTVPPAYGSSIYPYAVRGVGDTDGDGLADIALSSRPYGPTGAPTIALFTGTSPDGLVVRTTLSAPSGGTSLPSTVEAGGDVDADGYADVLVGSPGAAAAAGVYLGGRSGARTAPDIVLEPPVGDPAEGFGAWMAGADLNGDGRSDVVVGAPGADSGRGRLYVYYSSPTGLGPRPSRTLTPPGSEAFADLAH